MGPTRKRNGLLDPYTVTQEIIKVLNLMISSNVNIYQPERYTVNAKVVILSLNVNCEEIKYVISCCVILCNAMLCYAMKSYIMLCYHKVIKSNRKFQTFWLMRNKKKHRNELEYNHWLHLQPDEKIQIRNIKVVASQSRLKFSIY